MIKHKNNSNRQSQNQSARATNTAASPRPSTAPAGPSPCHPFTPSPCQPPPASPSQESINPHIHSSGTRTGKVARLPAAIREQLNQRLFDNESGPALLNWLNSLPEVQAVLAAEFDSVPVSASNLHHWKIGGYRDWLVHQHALSLVRNLDDQDALGDPALTEDFTEKLARWLSLQYASAATELLSTEDLDPVVRWRYLRQLGSDLTQLRRSDHQAQRLALERDRLELDCVNTEWQLKKETQAAEHRLLSLQKIQPVTPQQSSTDACRAEAPAAKAEPAAPKLSAKADSPSIQESNNPSIHRSGVSTNPPARPLPSTS